tara:strand:- start:769 stop:1893 length:1125 start_codon:yes stop_codon:yes gene_type:complete
MKNLLFYGTTNYGENLNNSNILKFRELSKNFSMFVMTYGHENKTVNHDYVTINYIKRPSTLISKYLKFYFLNFGHLKRFCDENNIDIISAKDPIAALLPTIIKKIYKREFKIVIEHHGDFLNLLLNQRVFKFKFMIKIFLKFLSNYAYKNCDFIRGVEGEYTKTLSNKYDKDFLIFPAWVDYKIYKPVEIEREGLIYVGNIIPRKGVLFLIKNFHEYSKKYNLHEKLLIVGEIQNLDYFNECNDYINKNNINNIQFLDSQQPEDLSKIYSSSRLLLMASNYEGLPRVLIESSLCGIPSLASNIQGISDPFGKYGGTILYKLNDSKDFQKKLHYFLNDNEIQKSLEEKAIALSSKLSGKNRFTNNWKKIEEKVYE